MLDEYLNREDVQLFIRSIKNMSSFRDKRVDSSSNYFMYNNTSLSLYVFYDALLKYAIIVDDKILFGKYIEQLRKIYSRSFDIEVIKLSINKLICRMVALKLDIKNLKNSMFKKQIISYIYNKYILGGYLIHGFSTVYESSLIDNMFVPEVYYNYYNKLVEVNNIFMKYCGKNIVDKDFYNNNVYFTNDTIMGCIYSLYSPNFFFDFLLNNNFYSKNKKRKLYLDSSFEKCSIYLKKFMDNKMFSDRDKKFVLSFALEEWNYLHSVDRKISLLLVKRSRILQNENVKLKDFLDDDSDIYEIIDRILCPKRNNVAFNDILYSNEYYILSLSDSVNEVEKEEIVEINNNDIVNAYEDKRRINSAFLNQYGKISILLILGSLFISFGVIITVFLIVWGNK